MIIIVASRGIFEGLVDVHCRVANLKLVVDLGDASQILTLT